jgi:hypothetical protein
MRKLREKENERNTENMIFKEIQKKIRVYCNDPPLMTQYCPLLAPPDQTSEEPNSVLLSQKYA